MSCLKPSPVLALCVERKKNVLIIYSCIAICPLSLGVSFLTNEVFHGVLQRLIMMWWMVGGYILSEDLV